MMQGLQKKEIQKAIGFGIRRIRERDNHTLVTFSNFLKKNSNIKISPNMLGKIERGEYSLNLSNFILICLVFKVDVEFFINDLVLLQSNNSQKKLINSKEVKELVSLILNQSDNLVALEKFQEIFKAVLELQKLSQAEVKNLKAAKKETSKSAF